MRPFLAEQHAGGLDHRHPHGACRGGPHGAVPPDPAIGRGAPDGIGILANISGDAIVLVTLVSLVNLGLDRLPHPGDAAFMLQWLFAYAFWPIMWLIGIPPPETATAAPLMGTKTVLNEFVAFIELARLPAEALSPRPPRSAVSPISAASES
jgi:concentrative nucleoside transporter, CNT family